MWRSFRLSMTVLLVMVAAMAVAVQPAATAPNSPWDKLNGLSVNFLVMDSETGQIRAEHGAHTQYRSASLVKLLIALDYFESRGPDVEVSPADRALLEPMLRSSDDRAASELWVREGWETIIERMVDRLGLTDTEPPADRRVWGYTATSAADVARVYAYLLAEADPPVRTFILGNLGKATRCATDGYDQYFGIPSAVDEPWTVKQGWSGYGDVTPGEECRERTAGRGSGWAAPEKIPAVRDAAIRAQAASGPHIDLVRRAMHTSGTIGEDNGIIMVVLSLHAEGTSYQDSANRVTTIARTLYLAVTATPADPTARWADVQSRLRAPA